MSRSLSLRLVLGAGVLWGLVRGFLALVGGVRPGILTSGIIALTVLLLVTIDSLAMRERVFLANLGVGPVAVAAHTVTAVLLLEWTLAWLGGLA